MSLIAFENDGAEDLREQEEGTPLSICGSAPVDEIIGWFDRCHYFKDVE
jgi:hypothetical protein